MAKTWVLDTDTKGTGAQVRPLEDVVEKPEERSRRRTPPKPAAGAPRPRKPAPEKKTTTTPLAPGQVRKKSTGEIGKIRSVDPKAGTAVVHWLRVGRTSTVRLTAISRR